MIGIVALSRSTHEVVNRCEAIPARVHSVFRRIVNLHAGGAVISVAGPELEIGPLTVSADLLPDFDWRLVVRPDQPVSVGCGRIDFGPAGPALSASDARLVDVRPCLPALAGGRVGLTARLEEPTAILRNRPSSLLSLLRLSPFGPNPLASFPESQGKMFAARTPPSLRDRGTETARSSDLDVAFQNLAAPALHNLWTGLVTDSPTLVAQGAAGFAGLGPGFTPSGDDFLCGTMAALWHVGRALGLDATLLDRLNSTIVAAALPRTDVLSGAWLAAAARGEVHPAIARMLVALAGGSEDDVHLAAREALEIGHSSGSDLVAGVLFGAESLLRLGAGRREGLGGFNTQHSVLSTR